MRTLRFTFVALVVVVCCAFSAAAQQKTYIGAETCGTCHKTQWVSQSTSGHAPVFPAAVGSRDTRIRVVVRLGWLAIR